MFLIVLCLGHDSVGLVLNLRRVLLLRVASHVVDIQTTDGALDEPLAGADLKQTVDIPGLHLKHHQVAFPVYHVDLYLAENNLSRHCFSHPVALDRQLVSLAFDLNSLSLFLVLVPHRHKLSVVADFLKVLLPRLLNVVVNSVHLLSLKMPVYQLHQQKKHIRLPVYEQVLYC